MGRDLQPFAQGLGLALSGLVVVLRKDDGPDVGKAPCGEADLFALASRWRSCGGEECLAGGASVDLGQAERVDGALGDDEGLQVSGGPGADGEQAAGSAGREASRSVGRTDLEAGEPAVPVAVGEEDAAAAVAADQGAAGVERLGPDSASGEPVRRRIR